jgi:hypothetical protein
MLAHITHFDHGIQELARALGEQHLTSVPGGADPRTAMHIDADIALVRKRGLAGVDPHSHSHGPTRKGVLRFTRCGDCARGMCEGGEQRVALSVDLDPIVLGDSGSQNSPVIREDVCIGRPEIVEQTGGSFDVREEEGHRPPRQSPHLPEYRLATKSRPSGRGERVWKRIGRGRPDFWFGTVLADD